MNKLLVTILSCIGLCALSVPALVVYSSAETDQRYRILDRRLVELRSLIAENQNEKFTYLKVLVLKPDADHALAKAIAKYVYEYAKIYDQDVDLMLSIIKHESDFDLDNFESHAGAIGPMQVLQGKQQNICKGLDIGTVQDNVHCGIRIYSHYNQEYSEHGPEAVLTTYNRGPNPVDIAVRDGRDPANDYARRVMGTYDMLRALDGDGSILDDSTDEPGDATIVGR